MTKKYLVQIEDSENTRWVEPFEKYLEAAVAHAAHVCTQGDIPKVTVIQAAKMIEETGEVLMFHKVPTEHCVCCFCVAQK